jgi:hypothetical protein
MVRPPAREEKSVGAAAPQPFSSWRRWHAPETPRKQTPYHTRINPENIIKPTDRIAK